MKIKDAVYAATILITSACGPIHHHPIRANVALDGSDSSPAVLRQVNSLGYDINDQLQSGDRLTVFVFGHSSECVYDGPKFPTRRAFSAAIGAILTKRNRAVWRPGTRDDLVLTDLAGHIDSSTPTVSVLVTDGGFEDHSAASMARIALALKSIRSNPNATTLVIAGASPEYRTEWEHLTEQCAGHKGSVRGFLDALPVIHEALATARQGGIK